MMRLCGYAESAVEGYRAQSVRPWRRAYRIKKTQEFEEEIESRSSPRGGCRQAAVVVCSCRELFAGDGSRAEVFWESRPGARTLHARDTLWLESSGPLLPCLAFTLSPEFVGGFCQHCSPRARIVGTSLLEMPRWWYDMVNLSSSSKCTSQVSLSKRPL
jgi:hypothetical protein